MFLLILIDIVYLYMQQILCGCLGLIKIILRLTFNLMNGGKLENKLTIQFLTRYMLVQDSSAVRQFFVRLAGAVGRQSALRKENSGYSVFYIQKMQHFLENQLCC